MITFLLNDKLVTASEPPGSLLLDYIRYNRRLTGTKIGCREGDCGACTILVGTLVDDQVSYRSATSCLMALSGAHGKHIVTIEGVNVNKLSPIQQAIAEEGATQCGFCTPGFVVSLAGFCLQPSIPTYENGIAAINGNICRCTGYKSLQRATSTIAGFLAKREQRAALEFATTEHLIPLYFQTAVSKLRQIKAAHAGLEAGPGKVLGGGTDLFVQVPQDMYDQNILKTVNNSPYIYQAENTCIISGNASVTDLIESPLITAHFPEMLRFIKLVSSTPIRNMATIAGNFVNASPIGDLTIFFLALNATIVFAGEHGKRKLLLQDFYLGYKKIDMVPGELLTEIQFDLPSASTVFNFEKVSKRTHLDIASVNTAMLVHLNNRTVSDCFISAGGVGPTPILLKKASEFMQGRSLDELVVLECLEIAQSEISPISDARGTASYKRLLLNQLLKAHFISFGVNLKPVH